MIGDDSICGTRSVELYALTAFNACEFSKRRTCVHGQSQIHANFCISWYRCLFFMNQIKRLSIENDVRKANKSMKKRWSLVSIFGIPVWNLYGICFDRAFVHIILEKLHLKTSNAVWSIICTSLVIFIQNDYIWEMAINLDIIFGHMELKIDCYFFKSLSIKYRVIPTI